MNTVLWVWIVLGGCVFGYFHYQWGLRKDKKKKEEREAGYHSFGCQGDSETRAEEYSKSKQILESIMYEAEQEKLKREADRTRDIALLKKYSNMDSMVEYCKEYRDGIIKEIGIAFGRKLSDEEVEQIAKCKEKIECEMKKAGCKGTLDEIVTAVIQYAGDKYSGCIRATPGAGKSMTAKKEMWEVLLRETDEEMDDETLYTILEDALGKKDAVNK